MSTPSHLLPMNCRAAEFDSYQTNIHHQIKTPRGTPLNFRFINWGAWSQVLTSLFITSGWFLGHPNPHKIFPPLPLTLPIPCWWCQMSPIALHQIKVLCNMYCGYGSRNRPESKSTKTQYPPKSIPPPPHRFLWKREKLIIIIRIHVLNVTEVLHQLSTCCKPSFYWHFKKKRVKNK